MNETQFKFLMLLRFPARLTAQQIAWLLNCQVHDIPALVTAKLIRPIGDPPANGVKFFHAQHVLERSNDAAWLARVTNTIHAYWRKKNAARNPHPNQSDQDVGE